MAVRLHGQCLSELPRELFQSYPNKIFELSLDENQLQTFSGGGGVPDNKLFENLVSLRRLSLRNNSLTTLPRSIKQLVCGEICDCRKNNRLVIIV